MLSLCPPRLSRLLSLPPRWGVLFFFVGEEKGGKEGERVEPQVQNVFVCVWCVCVFPTAKTEIVVPTTELLQKLLLYHRELAEQIAGECGEQLLQTLLENADNPEICAPVMQLLKDLALAEPEILDYLK